MIAGLRGSGSGRMEEVKVGGNDEGRRRRHDSKRKRGLSRLGKHGGWRLPFFVHNGEKAVPSVGFP